MEPAGLPPAGWAGYTDVQRKGDLLPRIPDLSKAYVLKRAAMTEADKAARAAEPVKVEPKKIRIAKPR